MGRFTSRRGRRPAVAGILLAFQTLVPATAGFCQVVINEILPDPAGPDEGREFVELFNPLGEPVSLAGVALQFGNGSVGPDWQTRWEGPEGLVLAAGARYLIVDRNWQGAARPQVEVYLGLQNGPDAVRLARGAETLDLVGYGPLTDPEMLEGEAVALVSGLSLARRPDGRDTDQNGQDFIAAEPTPGFPNFRDLDLRLVGWSLEPPSSDRPGVELQLRAELHNNGLMPWPRGEIQLIAGTGAHALLFDTLAPGESRTVMWVISSGTEPRSALAVRCPAPGDADTLTMALGWVQNRADGLCLNEVQPAPRQKQGEWIELRNLGDRPVDLADFRIKDEEGAWRPLPAVRLAAGGLALVAQDSLALAGWLDANAAAGDPFACGSAGGVLVGLSGWPTLNNSAPEGRAFCDRIQLADTTGTVIDHVTIGGGDPTSGPAPQDGRSLERMAARPRDPAAANWTLCTNAAEGTPGCPNSVQVPADPAAGPDIRPRLLDPGHGVSALVVTLTVAAPAAGCRVRIFDLWGGLVRDLGGDLLGPGARTRHWDGRDGRGEPVAPGGYLVLTESTTAAGSPVARDVTLVAVR